MRTTVLIVGWVLAVALGIVAAVQATLARDAREEAAHVAERLAAAQASVDELATRVDDVSGQMDDLLIELNELETAKAELEAASRAGAEAAVAPVETVTEAAAEDVASEGGAKKRKNPFAKMFGGVMTDEMVEASANLSAEQQYGDLIAELGLNDARSNQVREVLTRVLTEQMRATMNDGDTAAAAQEERSDRLRDELAQVLTEEDLVEFDQYQAVLPEKMLRQQYSVQLGTYASQLSEEDRTMALDVLVEESFAADATGASSGGDVSVYIERQTAVFDNTAARLAEVFDEGQMAPINRFLDQQRSALEMVMRMMESDEEEDAPTPK